MNKKKDRKRLRKKRNEYKAKIRKLFKKYKEIIKEEKVIEKKEEEKEKRIYNPLEKEYNKINDFSKYSTVDLINYFKDMIINCDIDNDYMKCSYEIIKRLDYDKQSFIYVSTILDAIKIKKYKLDKESVQYNTLKKVKKIFKNYKKLIDIKEETPNDNVSLVRYNIIFSLIFDDDNYLLIKALLNKCNDFLNIRVDNRHIVCYILDVYLKYLNELLNKNYDISDKINVDYMKEVYLLFMTDKNLKLTSSDIFEIENKLNTFISRITSEKEQKTKVIDGVKYNTILIKYNSKRDKIIDNLKTLYPSYKREKQYKLRNFRDYEFKCNLNSLMHISNNSYYDLTNKESVVISNPFVSYSYNKEGNILRISIPDISDLIDENSPIDSYMYNKTIKREKMDERLVEKLVYKDNQVTPSITFKVLLDKNNEPKHLYIYKSKVKPTFNIDSNTYKDIENDFGHRAEEKINNILNKAYLNLVKEEKIPYVFSGIEKIDDFNKDVFVRISSLSHTFSDADYDKIYNVITGNIGEFHYSNKEFSSSSFNMNLTRINYITLLNLRIIKKIIISNFTNKEDIKELIKEEINSLVDDLNENLGYKNPKTLFKKVLKKKNN